ncbi:MAG: hypothetical protein WHV28_09670 [Bacteroidota bacterium]
MRKKIKLLSLALEIEGLFSKDEIFIAPPGALVGGDGSIRPYSIEAPYTVELRYPLPYLGVDETLRIVQWIGDWLEAFDFRQNLTCGSHVHLFFNNTDKRRLGSFYFVFLKHLLHNLDLRDYDWLTILRERMDNRYSQINELSYEIHSGQDRYYAINFSSIWRHGSVEIRLFPNSAYDGGRSWDCRFNSNNYVKMVRLAIEAAEDFCNIVNRNQVYTLDDLLVDIPTEKFDALDLLKETLQIPELTYDFINLSKNLVQYQNFVKQIRR